MTFLQHVIPKHRISNIMFKFTRIKIFWIKNLFLRWFINKYDVNLNELEKTDIKDYKTINDFFIRSLKDGARVIDDSDLVSPVDGVVVQAGIINEIKNKIKAKGYNYSLEQLLAQKIKIVDDFNDFHTITIYLSPKDYHRVHMPFDAELLDMKYIPGKLFSVNQKSCNAITGIFAKNERLVCRFQTSFGEAFFILIGAMMVSSIEVVWENGEITISDDKGIREYKYHNRKIKLLKGEEMGRFNMGSSVIMLLPSSFKEIQIKQAQLLKVGQSII